jgi:hypothetical protein
LIDSATWRNIWSPTIFSIFASLQVNTMQQPRQQHYHFVYTALPSRVFAGRAASMFLAVYPDGFRKLLHGLWEGLGKQFPVAERSSDQDLKLTAHRIGGKHAVLVVHMPLPERMLEAYFIAIVFTPAVRYFTLGRSPSLAGLPDEVANLATLREVSPGSNARVGFIASEPTVTHLLEHLCVVFELPVQIESMTDEEVRNLAPDVPSCGPSMFDRPASEVRAFVESVLAHAQSRTKKHWWQFWK